jgi:hypothetical protein
MYNPLQHTADPETHYPDTYYRDILLLFYSRNIIVILCKINM